MNNQNPPPNRRRVNLDYTARDYDTLLASMRRQIPHLMPEWTNYESEADFGNVLLELFAHMGDILNYYIDTAYAESFLGTASERRSIIQHLWLIGYTLSTAAPASTVLKLLLPADCMEIITIERGTAFATKSSQTLPSVRFEYTQETPLTIDCNDPSVVRVEGNNKVYGGRRPDGTAWGIPVEEGRLVRDEVIGISDGSPNQQFALVHPRLILRSMGESQAINRDIILTTNLSDNIEGWTLRETLAFSRENQRDYAIQIDENDLATVIFGDGAFGAIPPQGAVIRATYRRGGGRIGNVPAETIQTIVDAPQLALLGAKVTNPAPATGGAERESIEHAVQHAPSVFRSFKRAVSADDYEALALDLKGVGKVRATANNWNTVTLFIAPEGGGQVSDVLRANLLAYFEDKRAISTILKIANVDYVKVYVTARIGVRSYYNPNDVKEQVQAAAGALLAFENVDFKQTIYLSKFYEAIEAIPGVEYVTVTEFRREDQLLAVDREGRVTMGDNEIPIPPADEADYSGGVRVLLPEDEE